MKCCLFGANRMRYDRAINDRIDTFLISISLDPYAQQGQSPVELVHKGRAHVIEWDGMCLALQEESLSEALKPGRKVDLIKVLNQFRSGGPASLDRFPHGFVGIIWDGTRSRLHLMRDRYGVCCLYYVVGRRNVAVSNRLDALIRYTGIEPRICPEALDLYFLLGLVPAPRTIYRDVRKVSAGCCATLANGRIDEQSFLPERPDTAPVEDDEETALQLERVLSLAVGRALACRQEPWLLFSGGKDSSLITSIVGGNKRQALRTLTLDFPGSSHSQRACRAAAVLGITPRVVPLENIPLEDLASLLGWLDEPTSDSMVFPQVVAQRAIASEKAVCLSGLGADALFMGLYEHAALDLWRRQAAVPTPHGDKETYTVGRMLAALRCTTDPVSGWIEAMGHFTGAERHDLLGAYLASQGRRDPAGEFLRAWVEAGSGFFDRAMQFGSRLGLPDMILRIAEAAARATQVPCVCPYLFPEVAHWSESLPLDRLIVDGTGKTPILTLLHRRHATSVWGLPKDGFGFPVAIVLDRQRQAWTDLLHTEPAKILNRSLVSAWVRQFEDPANRSRHHEAGSLWRVLSWLLWCQTHPVVN